MTPSSTQTPDQVAAGLNNAPFTYPRTGKRGVPQQFPRRLYEMLEIESSNRVVDPTGRYEMPLIAWSGTGRAFRIADVQLFANLVLPKYFRTSKFSSFQRNLNLYGFAKIRRGPETDMYAHPEFIRGRAESLSKLRKLKAAERKKCAKFSLRKHGQELRRQHFVVVGDLRAGGRGSDGEPPSSPRVVTPCPPPKALVLQSAASVGGTSPPSSSSLLAAMPPPPPGERSVEEVVHGISIPSLLQKYQQQRRLEVQRQPPPSPADEAARQYHLLPQQQQQQQQQDQWAFTPAAAAPPPPPSRHNWAQQPPAPEPQAAVFPPPVTDTGLLPPLTLPAAAVQPSPAVVQPSPAPSPTNSEKERVDINGCGKLALLALAMTSMAEEEERAADGSAVPRAQSPTVEHRAAPPTEV